MLVTVRHRNQYINLPNRFYFLQTMYAYCVYPATSKNYKTTAKYYCKYPK